MLILLIQLCLCRIFPGADRPAMASSQHQCTAGQKPDCASSLGFIQRCPRLAITVIKTMVRQRLPEPALSTCPLCG